MVEPIPYWVGKYIGIPFKERGRDISGCDCWGLCRLILKQEFGIILPSLSNNYIDPQNKETSRIVYETESRSDNWIPIAKNKEKCGDVICFRIKNIPCHVGLVIVPGFMLHIETGSNSCYVPYTTVRWKDKIDEVHRPRMLSDYDTKF